MRLLKNEEAKKILPEKIKSLDDICLIFESISKTYRHLLHFQFDLHKRVDDGIWKEVYMSAKRMAKEAECNEKTVHRFNQDMHAFVARRNRYKDGKQTSNVYRMHKVVYKFMKSFWRLGLWKEGVDYDERWIWIKKMWVECGCDTIRFMNKVWNHKPLSKKDKQTSYEQPDKKMSVGENEKCPSSSKSLSMTLDEYSTSWVSHADLKKISSFLLRKVRASISDMKWFSLEQGHFIRNFTGLFAERLSANLK